MATDLLGAPITQHIAVDCTAPSTASDYFSPGDLSKIGKPNRADPVIQPHMKDARANPPGSDVKPFVLGDTLRAIRTMKSVCPVPLSRPASQMEDDHGHGHGHGDASAEDPSLARTRVQIKDMLKSGKHCTEVMNNLKKRIQMEQAEERKLVYAQLAIADVDTAKREWMLMKDRHSRSKQDLWALARELKQVKTHTFMKTPHVRALSGLC